MIHYSITCSARNNSDRGTASPSALTTTKRAPTRLLVIMENPVQTARTLHVGDLERDIQFSLRCVELCEFDLGLYLPEHPHARKLGNDLPSKW